MFAKNLSNRWLRTSVAQKLTASFLILLLRSTLGWDVRIHIVLVPQSNVNCDRSQSTFDNQGKFFQHTYDHPMIILWPSIRKTTSCMVLQCQDQALEYASRTNQTTICTHSSLTIQISYHAFISRAWHTTSSIPISRIVFWSVFAMVKMSSPKHTTIAGCTFAVERITQMAK